MKIVFNPTGTHIHKGLLKVRMDFIPEVGEKSYPLQRIWMPTKVCPYDKGTPEFTEWLRVVPKVERTNPCLGVSFAIGETTTASELLGYLGKKFTADDIATLDYIQSLRDNLRYLVSFFKVDRVNLSREPVKTRDYIDLVQSVNQRFSQLLPIYPKLGIVRDIEAGTITIGSAVTDRASAQSSYTLIESTAADGTGTITIASFFFESAYGDAAGVEVATAQQVSANTFTTRDNEAIPGGVTAGSKQDFVVALDVVTGDYHAFYWTGTSRISTSLTTGSCWYKGGDNIPCTGAAFSTTTQTNSSGGTGTEAGGIIPRIMLHRRQMAEV